MNERTTYPFQIINREWLKILAMFFMLLDHAYSTVVSVAGFEWMTQIGRIAFPIFAFQITEGYIHTSNKNRFIKNMFIFALISEIPYNLMMGGEILGPFHQNVMFTFFIALLLLRLIDKVWSTSYPVILKMLLMGGICLLGIVIGTLTFVDYLGLGVLTVLLFYIAKLMPKRYLEMLVQFVSLWMINWIFLGGKIIILPNGMEFPEQGLALLSLPLIWLYNGKKVLTGKRAQIFKYCSYAFYPAHILILSLIALYIL